MSAPRDIKTVLGLPDDMTFCIGTKANGKRCSRGLSSINRANLDFIIGQLSLSDPSQGNRDSLRKQLESMAEAAFCTRDHAAQRPAAVQEWLDKISAERKLVGAHTKTPAKKKEQPQNDHVANVAQRRHHDAVLHRRNRSRAARGEERPNDRDHVIPQVPIDREAPGGMPAHQRSAWDLRKSSLNLAGPEEDAQPTPRPTKRPRHTQLENDRLNAFFESLERSHAEVNQAKEENHQPNQPEPEHANHAHEDPRYDPPAFDVSRALPIRSRYRPVPGNMPSTPGWTPSTPPAYQDPSPFMEAPFRPRAFDPAPPWAEFTGGNTGVRHDPISFRPQPSAQGPSNHQEPRIPGAWPTFPFPLNALQVPSFDPSRPAPPNERRSPVFEPTRVPVAPTQAAQPAHSLLQLDRDPTDTFYIAQRPSYDFVPTADYDPLIPSRLPLSDIFLQRLNFFLSTQDPNPFTSEESAHFHTILTAEDERRRLKREGEGKVVRKKVEGECPICLEEMVDGGKEVVWCERGCGNNLHGECLEGWRGAGKEGSGRCVVCWVVV